MPREGGREAWMRIYRGLKQICKMTTTGRPGDGVFVGARSWPRNMGGGQKRSERTPQLGRVGHLYRHEVCERRRI
jgi:hypothetical protein